MNIGNLRELLERQQIAIYFSAVAISSVIAMVVPGTAALEGVINPALAFMLFVTFLQVPLAELGQAFKQVRFMGALLVANFIIIPMIVLALVHFFLEDQMLRLGVMLVLLAPCIDYVVTFAHLGRADARLLLASTPVLLIVQMLLLPVYLGLALGEDAARFVEVGPFVHAFVWLIAVPLVLAGVTQLLAGRSDIWKKISEVLGLTPVPATALVLFIVILAVVPQLGPAIDSVLLVLPLYVAYAVLAPVCGWWVARQAELNASASRSVAFSSATRNSLVVLPLALAIPGAIPVLPAIIVAQTLVNCLANWFMCASLRNGENRKCTNQRQICRDLILIKTLLTYVWYCLPDTSLLLLCLPRCGGSISLAKDGGLH
uniref:Putative Na+-dependent transporter n=1 Tax=Herminiimonas arsenicoxydans TaxID=204773 RepID=Q5QCN8_HERAR|nr:putative Na+-dependent transporter [Herminiimonas arsenicoxydans]